MIVHSKARVGCSTDKGGRGEADNTTQRGGKRRGLDELDSTASANAAARRHSVQRRRWIVGRGTGRR